MTRFKKEIRKRGFRIEEDYEYLPYNGLEAVIVNSESCTVKYCYNMTDDCLYKFDRDMSFTETWYHLHLEILLDCE